jgi:hypothetical protein
VALLVQHEPAQLGPLHALDSRDDVLRACHLRNEVVAHERDGLHARNPRAGQAADELRAHRGGEDVRLVLEPVARADVADDHDSILYAVTRSGFNRAITRCSPSGSV